MGKRDNDLYKRIEEFEEGFPDGVYAIPRDPKAPRINIRAMYAYCEQRGIDLDQLTDQERKQFIARGKKYE